MSDKTSASLLIRSSACPTPLAPESVSRIPRLPGYSEVAIGYKLFGNSQRQALWKNVDFQGGGLLAVTEAMEQTRKHGVRLKAPKSRSSRPVFPVAEGLLVVLREHKAR